MQSDIIKNTNKNPNFDKPLIFLDVMLPKEELYMPPMNMRVRDHRQFGRKPTVGLYILKTMDKYRYPPLTEDHDPLADMPSNEKLKNLLLLEVYVIVDWFFLPGLSDPAVGPHDTVIEMPSDQETGRKKKVGLKINNWSRFVLY